MQHIITLDHAQAAEYVDTAGKECPVCKSLRIGSTGVYTRPSVHKGMQCASCGATWKELYKLSSITEVSYRLEEGVFWADLVFVDGKIDIRQCEERGETYTYRLAKFIVAATRNELADFYPVPRCCEELLEKVNAQSDGTWKAVETLTVKDPVSTYSGYLLTVFAKVKYIDDSKTHTLTKTEEEGLDRALERFSASCPVNTIDDSKTRATPNTEKEENEDEGMDR